MNEDIKAFLAFCAAIGRLICVLAGVIWRVPGQLWAFVKACIPEIEPQDDPCAPLSIHYLNDEPEPGCRCRACFLLKKRQEGLSWVADVPYSEPDSVEEKYQKALRS